MEFQKIVCSAQQYLDGGGSEAAIPAANQLWMLVGFDLFRRLRREWECLEVFPHAIAVVLKAAHHGKSDAIGCAARLRAASRHTGWREGHTLAALGSIGYGARHDKLDAYFSAWVASLEEPEREPLGGEPDDTIWLPRLNADDTTRVVPHHGRGLGSPLVGGRIMGSMTLHDAATAVGETAGKEIVDFSVGLVSLVETNSQADASLAGSGTLVDLNGTCGILTAWHVLRHLTDKDIGLVLPTRFEPRRHAFTLESKDVQPLKIAFGTNEADGPDLGVLVLPPPVVSSIKARKPFYNLSRRRDAILANPRALDDGLWYLSGFAGELTEQVPPEGGYTTVKVFRGGCANVWVERGFCSGDFDYLECEVGHGGRDEPPSSLGGYSGAGLWQVPLKKTSDGKLEPEAFLLSGVAFYQSPRSNDRRIIRCHGRRSVYVQALAFFGQRLAPQAEQT